MCSYKETKSGEAPAQYKDLTMLAASMIINMLLLRSLAGLTGILQAHLSPQNLEPFASGFPRVCACSESLGLE